MKKARVVDNKTQHQKHISRRKRMLGQLEYVQINREIDLSFQSIVFYRTIKLWTS